jgi:hypothetical protein
MNSMSPAVASTPSTKGSAVFTCHLIAPDAWVSMALSKPQRGPAAGSSAV